MGAYGDEVGPMVRTMASSPAVLAGYIDLSRAVKRSKLPRPISERISLAMSLNVLTGTFYLVAGLEPADTASTTAVPPNTIRRAS